MKSITLMVNGQSQSYQTPLTLQQLLQQLDFANKRIAVELNGAIVPKSQYEDTLLKDQDRLEVVVAVGGG